MICHIQLQWNVIENVRNRIKKYEVIIEKSLSEKKYLEIEIRRHLYVAYMSYYLLSKYEGKQTNSLWLAVLYACNVCNLFTHGAPRSSQELVQKLPVHSRIELEFGNAGFWGEGKTGEPGEKPLGAE